FDFTTSEGAVHFDIAAGLDAESGCDVALNTHTANEIDVSSCWTHITTNVVDWRNGDDITYYHGVAGSACLKLEAVLAHARSGARLYARGPSTSSRQRASEDVDARLARLRRH